MAHSVLADVEGPVAQQLPYTSVAAPVPALDAVEHNLLTLRLDDGNPLGQGIAYGSSLVRIAVEGDPEHAVIGVGQSGVEVLQRKVEIADPDADVPVTL